MRVPSGERVLAYHLDVGDPALRGLRSAQVLLLYARRLPLLAPVLPESVSHISTQVRPFGSAVLSIADGVPGSEFYAVGDSVLAFDPLWLQGLFHALASAERTATAIAREFEGYLSAGQHYFLEMRHVQARYYKHLAATYARPVRYCDRPFWA
ncbi:hypothetical protein HFK74_23855|uniref:hypothetical protein n=1 Tax=Pseudomonas sp. SbOxS1 TaxID=2723884 RepID=UPI0015D21F15|nr:hypothetical protein [Pseudomonas sp. SbOxS1]NYU05735.1 hypothetical protein [Pseudomonas sp. SbOxS1]